MQGFAEFFITEDFDTVSDFLLNPEHRNKTWDQLMKEFEASGGEYAGGGRHASVFSHPRWPYVLKMFHDVNYLRFARFAYKTSHSAFPKLFGPPQKVVPFYKRTPEEATTYIARIELLQPVDAQLAKIIIDWYPEGLSYVDAVKRGVGDAEVEQVIRPSFKERRNGAQPQTVKVKRYQDLFDVFKRNPKIKTLYEGLALVCQGVKECALDMHPENIMKRNNGDLVLIDPVWEGSNPYSDYQAMLDSETDRWGDYEPPEPTLVGGKMPTKKRPWRKAKKAASAARRAQEDHDEVPF